MTAKYGESVSSCRQTSCARLAGGRRDPLGERRLVLGGVLVPALLHEADAEGSPAGLVDAGGRRRDGARGGDQPLRHRGESNFPSMLDGSVLQMDTDVAAPRMRRVAVDIHERIGRNEPTFRSINEDIERGRDADDDHTMVGFVCQCRPRGCGGRTVVERHDRYAVMRKLETSGAVAKETDPRA